MKPVNFKKLNIDEICDNCRHRTYVDLRCWYVCDLFEYVLPNDGGLYFCDDFEEVEK